MTEADDPRIGTRYRLLDVGSGTVAVISDEANERAWVQSTLTVPVEP